MKEIFVFGSNLAGRHGAGSALYALKYHGAILGQGVGRQGNSYAIPTKDAKLKTLSIYLIKKYVDEFLAYADANRDDTFTVVKIGCGLAGYSEQDMKPLFRRAPQNVILPEGWRA